jgi:hypothetical protein
MKWLASAIIIGSSVVMPHWQNCMNSSHSIPLSLFQAHIFVSLFFHHTEELITFCHHFSKEEMMLNTALRTTLYLCSLLFLQSITSQKCIISSTPSNISVSLP